VAAPALEGNRSRLAALRERLPRGVDSNEQLTATVATVLLVLLTLVAATALNLHQYLKVHVFVGMLVLPVVVLKLATTGWRFASYYRGAEEYVRRGPPPLLLRFLIAPVVVASTFFLFGSGVALVALGRRHGPLVGLHAASSAVWLVSMGLHVLTRLGGLPDAWRRLPGRGVRIGVVAATLAAGVVLAVATLPAADHLQDHFTRHAGFDNR
jgi:hypothetical protein